MGDNSKEGMLILIPLAVTDASIVWWISFERIFVYLKSKPSLSFLCCINAHGSVVINVQYVLGQKPKGW